LQIKLIFFKIKYESNVDDMIKLGLNGNKKYGLYLKIYKNSKSLKFELGVSLPIALASELQRWHIIHPLPSFLAPVFSTYSHSPILKNMYSINPKLLHNNMHRVFLDKETEAVLLY
jgi:hypothetical protein